MTNTLLKLKDHGQSVWYDNLNRDFIRTGALQRLVDEDGISGGTSNPSIFEKALSASDAYDDHLRDLVRQGLSLPEIYDALTVTDVQLSCDVFDSICERTHGADGYASLEVSPEIADDTEATTRDARRLFAALDRRNGMIKIPGTQAGLKSIEDSLADGLNINITLLFGVENYEQVAWAHISALERRREAGLPIDRIASVASFFVSRVDTAVDKKLEEIGRTDLSGKAGVANAKIAYAKFKEIRASDRWQALEGAGARVQRPLWASTSTKNPSYRDVIYVDELIGPDTINTMPDVTIEAFREHGEIRGNTLDEEIDDAFRHIETLESLGIDFRALTDQLQVEGVRLFSEAFHKAGDTLKQKRDQVLTEQEQQAGVGPGQARNT